MGIHLAVSTFGEYKLDRKFYHTFFSESIARVCYQCELLIRLNINSHYAISVLEIIRKKMDIRMGRTESCIDAIALKFSETRF